MKNFILFIAFLIVYNGHSQRGTFTIGGGSSLMVSGISNKNFGTESGFGCCANEKYEAPSHISYQPNYQKKILMFSYSDLDIIPYLEMSYYPIDRLKVILNTFGFKRTTKYEGPDFSQAFHTFTLVWTPNKIEWYVDGDLKRRTTLYYTIQGQTVDCNSLQAFQPYILDKAFPRDPMNIIASVGIQTGVNAPNQNTSFPNNFEIDYIKYYKQMPCEGSVNLDDISDLNLNPEIYNVVVGTTINLSDNFTLPSDQQLALIASDEINLSNNTNIEPGSNFDAIIDNSICQNLNKKAINENQNTSNKFNPDVDSVYNDTPFKIYPNPNDGEFFVEFIPELSQSYKIYVTNDNGKIIYNKSDIKRSKVEVDLSNQKAGVFSLYVVDSNREKVYTHKIIKSK